MSNILLLNTQKDLYGGLSGNAFSNTIKLCFSKATSFSLIQRNVLPTYPCFIAKKLSLEVLKVYRVNQWFAWTGGEYDEILYKATPQTMEVILRYFDDIFMHNRKKIPKSNHEQTGEHFLYPSYLEDLCFFVGKRMFFGTLSHEYICAAKPIDAMFEKSLRGLASWDNSSYDCYGMDRQYI